MPATYSSAEFSETQVLKFHDDDSHAPATYRKQRFDVFQDEDRFELYLVDREYIWGQTPRDVNVLSMGMFASMEEAQASIEEFVSSYLEQQHRSRLDNLRSAFAELVRDPAACGLAIPDGMISRQMLRLAG